MLRAVAPLKPPPASYHRSRPDPITTQTTVKHLPSYPIDSEKNRTIRTIQFAVLQWGAHQTSLPNVQEGNRQAQETPIVRFRNVRIRIPIPKNPLEWLDEIATAYVDAREAMPFGRFVGQDIHEKDLYHMAPSLCIKFRGVKRSEKLLEKATDAALSSYFATRDVVGDVMDILQIVLAFCYLASHFGLDLVDQELVQEVMDHMESKKETLLKKTSTI